MKIDLSLGIPAIGRRPSEEQVYSRLFYHTRCKAAVKDYFKTNDTPFQEQVAERARITAAMYASETDEAVLKAVKDEIDQLEEKRSLAKAALEALETGEQMDCSRSPLDYAQ